MRIGGVLWFLLLSPRPRNGSKLGPINTRALGLSHLPPRASFSRNNLTPLVLPGRLAVGGRKGGHGAHLRPPLLAFPSVVRLQTPTDTTSFVLLNPPPLNHRIQPETPFPPVPLPHGECGWGWGRPRSYSGAPIRNWARFTIKGTQFLGFPYMAANFSILDSESAPTEIPRRLRLKKFRGGGRSYKPPPKKGTGTAFCAGPR
jgi:hypothetical protein